MNSLINLLKKVKKFMKVDVENKIMNAEACNYDELCRKQRCPVTGLPILHRPEWTYTNPSSDYRITISVLGAGLILSQPSGHATLEDVKTAMQIMEQAVAEGIPGNSPYIEIEDYTRLKGVSFAGRLFFIKSMNSNPRISAVLFCGVSELFRASIKLGRYIYKTAFPVLITEDCAEGLDKAREMLPDMPPQPENGVAAERRLQTLASGPLESSANPEWNLRLEGFTVQYGVLDNTIIHAVSTGFLEERHIQPIIEMMETVYAAMGSPREPCYCLNGVSDVRGSTHKARQRYYDAIKQWFRVNPGFRIYIFYGAGRLLKAAIHMTSAFAPFAVQMANNLESGLQIIDQDRREISLGQPAISEPEEKAPFSTHVNELLHYLGVLDFVTDEKTAGRPADPDHPFLPVFDGIDLIKSDLDTVLMERNEVERSLVREKQLSESIFDHIPAGIAFLDSDFILRKYNRNYARFLEAYSPYAPEACLGKPYSEYLPGIWAQVEDWYKSVRDTGIPNNRHNYRLIFEKQGQQVATFWDRSIVPIRNASEKVTGILILTTDVTEQKAAAEKAEKLDDQLKQAQKMESIGTLAGGIAHDFNNILSAIIGYTEIALMDLPENSMLNSSLEEVIRAGGRARDLVRQILTFSRQGNSKMVPFRIEPVVAEVLQLIRATLPTTTEIRFQGGSNAMVMGDTTQIHQVLMNLCINAGHAMAAGKGILTIEIAEQTIPDDVFDNERQPLLPGRYVLIEVGDTGQGMTPDVRARIFDPYFTTKKPGHGTGMGLAVTHGIVKSHNGTITVESEPGEGSRFTICLPTIKEKTDAERKPSPPVAGGSESILLVDDEKGLADMWKQMMKNLGYRVKAMTSGAEALEVFKTDPDRFDVVITDMTMPNMTGVDLSRQILQIRPDIPIILSTGFSEQITETQAKALGIRAFISKPILKADLARTVREVLESVRVEQL
jgi:signal transduction histidine kinase/ActR/RegA family two-component response regulator